MLERIFEFSANSEYNMYAIINSGGKQYKIYPLPKGLKLFYHFDFGDDWYFKIMRSRKKPKMPENGIEHPRLIESIGQAPKQYPEWDE